MDFDDDKSYSHSTMTFRTTEASFKDSTSDVYIQKKMDEIKKLSKV